MREQGHSNCQRKSCRSRAGRNGAVPCALSSANSSKHGFIFRTASWRNHHGILKRKLIISAPKRKSGEIVISSRRILRIIGARRNKEMATRQAKASKYRRNEARNPIVMAVAFGRRPTTRQQLWRNGHADSPQCGAPVASISKIISSANACAWRLRIWLDLIASCGISVLHRAVAKMKRYGAAQVEKYVAHREMAWRR